MTVSASVECFSQTQARLLVTDFAFLGGQGDRTGAFPNTQADVKPPGNLAMSLSRPKRRWSQISNLGIGFPAEHSSSVRSCLGRRA